MFLLSMLLKFGVPDRLAKILAPFLLILVVGGAVVASYAFTYHHGRLFERGLWKAKIAEYEQKLTQNKLVFDGLVATMKSDNEQLVLVLEERLKASEARKDRIKIVIKEVPKYVTPKADAQCVLTTGFSWMYNAGLDNTTLTGIPPGKPDDVDAPTGLKISDVAAIAAENNSECSARGEVIKAWQEWYPDVKKNWDAVRAAQPPDPELPK